MPTTTRRERQASIVLGPATSSCPERVRVGGQHSSSHGPLAGRVQPAPDPARRSVVDRLTVDWFAPVDLYWHASPSEVRHRRAQHQRQRQARRNSRSRCRRSPSRNGSSPPSRSTSHTSTPPKPRSSAVRSASSTRSGASAASIHDRTPGDDCDRTTCGPRREHGLDVLIEATRGKTAKELGGGFVDIRSSVSARRFDIK